MTESTDLQPAAMPWTLPTQGLVCDHSLTGSSPLAAPQGPQTSMDFCMTFPDHHNLYGDVTATGFNLKYVLIKEIDRRGARIKY